MKNLLSCLLLVVLIFGCGQKAKTVDQFNSSDYKENYIDFISGNCLLPEEYREIKLSELITHLEEKDSTNLVAKQFVNSIHTLKSLKNNYQIFANEHNPSEFLWFIGSEQFSFQKSDANQYLGMLEQGFNQTWGAMNIPYNRIENKISKTNKSEYIKIKYEIGNSYASHYVVSSPISTFGIWELKNSIEDFEELFKRIAYSY